MSEYDEGPCAQQRGDEQAEAADLPEGRGCQRGENFECIAVVADGRLDRVGEDGEEDTGEEKAACQP